MKEKSNIFYVYHLIDPITNIPFYIGKGYGNRMYDHERSVMSGKHPNNNHHLFYKIKKILNECGRINYKKIIENIDEQSALLKESEEIKRMGRADLKSGPLCNLTDGGDGVSGLKMSESAKSKMKIRVKKWFSDPKHRKETSIKTKLGMIKSGYIDRISKSITLKSPNGKIITVKNINKFCRENNLGNANLYKVIRGKIKQHRGWTLPTTILNKPEYRVIDISGISHTFTSIPRFCRENNLTDTSLRCLLQEKLLTHKGFIKYTNLNGQSVREYIKNIKHKIYSESNKNNWMGNTPHDPNRIHF